MKSINEYWLNDFPKNKEYLEWRIKYLEKYSSPPESFTHRWSNPAIYQIDFRKMHLPNKLVNCVTIGKCLIFETEAENTVFEDSVVVSSKLSESVIHNSVLIKSNVKRLISNLSYSHSTVVLNSCIGVSKTEESIISESAITDSKIIDSTIKDCAIRECEITHCIPIEFSSLYHKQLVNQSL